MLDQLEPLTRLGFHQVIWLLPVAALLHVLEELPRFADWATRSLKVPYTRSKFIWENVVLFMILCASVVLVASSPAESVAGRVGHILVLGAAVSFFSNMLFHGLYTLKSGVYSPGTVTACLLFTPLSIYVYYLAAVEGLLTLYVVLLSAALGLALLPMVVTVVHRVIDGRIRPRTLVKLALMGALPPLVMTVASALFDVDSAVLHKIMIYVGPLALLPLVVKWVWRRTKEREQDPSPLVKGEER